MTEPAGLSALLAELPVDAGDVPAEVIVDGMLLRGGEETFRVIVGATCLTLAREDVIGVERREYDDGTYAVSARVRLRRPAQLLAIEPSDHVWPLARDASRPFAIAARPRPAWTPVTPGYEERQTAVLRALIEKPASS